MRKLIRSIARAWVTGNGFKFRFMRKRWQKFAAEAIKHYGKGGNTNAPGKTRAAGRK